VIPLGDPNQTQQLVRLVKQADGSTTSRVVLSVVFVPLTHGTSD
jgi:protein-L-isoaspartate O-methyltransferase